MIEIVWEFQVVAGHEEEFERHYGPQGIWAELFQRDPSYLGTTLLRDRERQGRYLTVDRWEGPNAFEKFKARFDEDYRRIDEAMERLTTSETKIGVFESSSR